MFIHNTFPWKKIQNWYMFHYTINCWVTYLVVSPKCHLYSFFIIIISIPINKYHIYIYIVI